MWTVKNLFLEIYGVDTPVINGNQLLLHWNEFATQKTKTFKNMDSCVKENYSLSRERDTVFMQISSDPAANFIPEFGIKGKKQETN